MDFGDVELSLIKARLLKEIAAGDVPDLLELTRIAQRVSEADLETALRASIHARASDYAVITGIQLHAPDGNYVWPASGYAAVNGIRRELELGQIRAESGDERAP